jgi:hypothetical protein
MQTYYIAIIYVLINHFRVGDHLTNDTIKMNRGLLMSEGFRWFEKVSASHGQSVTTLDSISARLGELAITVEGEGASISVLKSFKRLKDAFHKYLYLLGGYQNITVADEDVATEQLQWLVKEINRVTNACEIYVSKWAATEIPDFTLPDSPRRWKLPGTNWGNSEYKALLATAVRSKLLSWFLGHNFLKNEMLIRAFASYNYHRHIVTLDMTGLEQELLDMVSVAMADLRQKRDNANDPVFLNKNLGEVKIEIPLYLELKEPLIDLIRVARQIGVLETMILERQASNQED